MSRTTDDATETEYSSTEAVIEESNSSKLAKRLREMQDAADEAHESYSLTVYKRRRFSRVAYHVRIESSEWYRNKGEVGDSNFSVTLGPRGGLHRATHRSDIPGSDTREFHEERSTVSNAWRSLLSSIRRAR